MLYRAHRALGAALLLPLLLWSSTGLLFHLKPGWQGAYEVLDSAVDQPIAAAELMAISEVAATADGSGTLTSARLRSTVLGPIYVLSVGDTTSMVHATSGEVLSPLSRDNAIAIARAATSRSQAAWRYGDPVETHVLDDSVEIEFAAGTKVSVNRTTGSLSQRGPDTLWIDRLYRWHYLQWTGSKTIDQLVGLLGIVAIWGLALAGLALLLRRRGRGSMSAEPDNRQGERA